MKKAVKKTENRPLPPMPDRIAKLPVQRGYPVPWFVAEVEPGVYDFRVADAGKKTAAIRHKLCWVCGEELGATLAFPIGPMCAINRVISEPPSHRECAEWSIKACPFLTQQQTRRNEQNLPDGTTDPGGISIRRQPGVVCLWITNTYRTFDPGNGVLFSLGEPSSVTWWREGRAATREEVMESIESGLPILQELADRQGKFAPQELIEQVKRAAKYLPTDQAPKKALFGSAARR